MNRSILKSNSPRQMPSSSKDVNGIFKKTSSCEAKLISENDKLPTISIQETKYDSMTQNKDHHNKGIVSWF